MEKLTERKIIFIALCFFIAAAAVVKLDEITDFLVRFFALMMPVIMGFLTAALLNSPVRAAESGITRLFPAIKARTARISRLPRYI